MNQIDNGVVIVAEHEQHKELFKTCYSCGQAWPNRIDFLTDAQVTMVGYQVNFANLEDGLFVFEHSCGCRLTLSVSQLSDLFGGPIFEQRQTGNEECPELCLHGNDFTPCPEQCECAYVREILQLFACPL